MGSMTRVNLLCRAMSVFISMKPTHPSRARVPARTVQGDVVFRFVFEFADASQCQLDDDLDDDDECCSEQKQRERDACQGKPHRVRAERIRTGCGWLEPEPERRDGKDGDRDENFCRSEAQQSVCLRSETRGEDAQSDTADNLYGKHAPDGCFRFDHCISS